MWDSDRWRYSRNEIKNLLINNNSSGQISMRISIGIRHRFHIKVDLVDKRFLLKSVLFIWLVVQTSTSLIWPQTDSMFYSIDSSANNQSMMTMPNNWISPVVVRRSIYLTMDHQIENELPQHRRQSNGKTSRTRKSHLSADEENRLIHHRSQKSNEHSSRQSTRTHWFHLFNVKDENTSINEMTLTWDEWFSHSSP